MRIGELAKSSNTSVEALRFYEKEGLLCSPERSENGYRDYPISSVPQMKFVLRAKKAGFTLKECRELLTIRYTPENYTCGDVKTLSQIKLKQIEEKIVELQQMQHTLSIISDACCGGNESAEYCSILSALEEEGL